MKSEGASDETTPKALTFWTKLRPGEAMRQNVLFNRGVQQRSSIPQLLLLF